MASFVHCAKRPGPSDNEDQTDRLPRVLNHGPFFQLGLPVVDYRQTPPTIHHPVMPTDPTDEHGGSLSKAQAPPSSSRSSEASPSSLIMARGRSRVRRISSDADPFSEENLRKRYVSRGANFYFTVYKTSYIFQRSGYHSLKSFDQSFHLEKRWKLVREMGSGAYGVVMLVRVPSSRSCLCFLPTSIRSALRADPFIIIKVTSIFNRFLY